MLKNNTNYRQLSGTIFYENDPNAVVAVGIVNSKFAKDKPELAKKVIQAMDKAQEFIKNHEEEAREIIPKYVNMPSELAKKHTLINFSKSNEVNEVNLKRYLAFLQEIGEISDCGNI